MNRFESRCGVCCSICVRKEKVNCTGCLTISVPFWGGVCEVKKCCESKQLNHCGECETFPYDILSNMAKEQGFDPMVKPELC